MTIIVLDPRFPTAIPLEAASLLTGEVSYTEEVPIRVRWAIADAGGHSVSDAEILVTTDVDNDDVQDRIAAGERIFDVGLAEAPSPAAATGISEVGHGSPSYGSGRPTWKGQVTPPIRSNPRSPPRPRGHRGSPTA